MRRFNLPFIIYFEVKKVALSQEFEARRRERLKQQHKKREKMRKIRKAIFFLAAVVLVVVLVSSIVRCAKKPSEAPQPSTATTQTAEPTEAPTEAVFDKNIPEPKEGENNYLNVIKDSGQKQHIYLTFDGGPADNVTPKILDVLRRYNVKATFFMTGSEIEAAPYLCTRAMEEGHLVLPLSKSGSADILYADKTTFMDEVEETYKLITDNSPSTVKPVKLYRFIGGSYSNSNYGAQKKEYADELAKNGYYYCDWNTTIGDSSASKTAEQLVSYFTSNKPQLNNLIIQMHNTKDNIATAEALGDIIEKLMSDGYTFSRLDEIDFSGSDNSTKTEEAPASPDSEKTAEPKATAKSDATAAPAATKKPIATAKPASTAKPAATKKATVTEPPKTATLPPASGVNEIESE